MKDSQPAIARINKKPKRFKRIFTKATETLKKPDSKDGLVKSAVMIFLDVFLVVIPLSIFIVFLMFYYFNTQTTVEVNEKEILSVNYKFNLSSYPIVDGFINPNITAQAAIVADADSHTVLYSKNPELRFSIASITKIMTALVGLEYYKERSVLTIHSAIIEGSHLGFEKGDRFYFRDLLYAMLLPSSNEAAYAIAQNYPGGTDAFVLRMNEKASELNFANTNFSDPAGLDDDNNYSNVSDLSRLAAYAMKNDTLASIFSTKQRDITEMTGLKEFHLQNLNKLLGIDGVNGIKTGTTEGAGEVLVTSKVDKNHTFIVIVMKSQQRFVDTKALFSLISNHVRFVVPEYPASLITKDI